MEWLRLPQRNSSFQLRYQRHQKRLDVNKSVITDFEEFLDKSSPLKDSNKLGAILLQTINLIGQVKCIN
jgi:hypothetical protein